MREAFAGACLALFGLALGSLAGMNAAAQPGPFGPPQSVPRPAQAPATASPAAPSRGPVPVGSLDAESWRAYRARFVTEDGRVVDTANGSISHSEGQGYALLLAVAAGDRATFELIWNWTRANLMVRGDELLAWRWEPNKRPAVADMNNATDGDLLVAWALVEAAEAWKDPTHRVAARRMATEIGRRTVIFKGPNGPILLPGVNGFSTADRSDGPVVNLSYWIFPAFPRLAIVAPEFDWDRLGKAGLELVSTARIGPARLPPEWLSLRDGRPRPADGFPSTFSYNAIRIPLYLIWGGHLDRALLEPFATLWGDRERNGLPVVDTASGNVEQWLDETGYTSLATLVACATTDAEAPGSFFQVRTNENYYPVTLHLMARVIAKLRFPRCSLG